ncbi:unnamed protein product [Orchesella dallaii]|uniref:F-box domain-containing protein n=1 Tax=Orchesella dallaii TaxID=48710 RepID=A0ABP1R2A2_9HEXA
MESVKKFQKKRDAQRSKSESETSESEESVQRFHNETPPMENPVILSRLFELCPQKQLAKFRSVCKQWYSLSLASWRSSVQLVFWGDTIFANIDSFWDESTSTYDTEEIPTLRKFIAYVEDEKNDCFQKPYRRFCLKEWNMKDKDKDGFIQAFFTTCGPLITDLELIEPNFYEPVTFRKVLFTAFPNLQSLIMKDHQLSLWNENPLTEGKEYEAPKEGEHLALKKLHIDMNHEHLPLTWLDILSHFPNLENIRLYNADREQIENMLKAIKIIRKKNKRKLALKHLDILSADLYAQDELYPSICELIHELKLPLETLTIDLGVSTSANIVQDVLETHQKTLKKLDVYRGPMAKPFYEFPFGVNLQALQEISCSDRIFMNLHFMKFAPNLKRLLIFDESDGNGIPILDSEIIRNTFPSEMERPNVGKFVTEFRFDYTCSREDVRNLTIWFPNIKKLKMPLDNDQFSKVCKRWRDLEEIFILGNEMTDHGITGRILPCKNYQPTLRIRPNITYLTNLRSFKICNGTIVPTKLMDNSAIHGFLHCPHLQHLEVASQMNDHVRKEVYAKIPNCNITRIRYNREREDWD